MIINHDDLICYISKINHPHKIWYHIRIDLGRYGEDYIEEKLGIFDPAVQQIIQDEFYKAVKSYKKSKQSLLESHVLRFNKTDFPFYLANKKLSSVTVYLEKGLFTLHPDQPNGMKNAPRGYPHAVICKTDTPEMIRDKFYDTWKSFGIAMHRKLKRIMNW